jgi:hypothetical protein
MEKPQMAQTELGNKVEGWSPTAREDLKADLNKLLKVEPELLGVIVDKIAKSAPACNVPDLVALEAEKRSVSDFKELAAVVSAISFVLTNMDGQSAKSVTEDLTRILSLSTPVSAALSKLLESAEPFRESALAAVEYIKVGAPLFATIRGVVDVRLRFHKTASEFEMNAAPSRVQGIGHVMMVDLTVTRPNRSGDETVLSFLMDENDLAFMKRFVTHMERELEMSKEFVRTSGYKK